MTSAMMRAVRRTGRTLAMLALLALCVPGTILPARADAPRRIVSLNLCSDQLLVDLVQRERIAGLSHLAADPQLSAIADRVAGHALIRGGAEEILALAPDLVVAGDMTTPATVSLLRRLGIPIVTVPLASDFEGVRVAVRTLADAVGARERGEAMIANLDAALARSAVPAGARPPTAIAYQINSLASGQGSLVDTVMKAAGLRNGAAAMRLGPGGRMPLETLVVSPPDLIVLAHGADDYRTVSADNLRHPALKSILRRTPHVDLEMPLWLCGTPRIAEAVERLRAARPVPVALREGAR